MFNWNVLEKTYVYDGTFEGLLSIIFDCYIKKVIPTRIVPKNNVELSFFEQLEEKVTDYKKSNRIFNGIVKNISYDTLYNSYYAFLSKTQEKEINILKYILNGFIIGPKINTMLSIDFVFAVHSMRKKMLFESHRLKGLLRFIEVEDNIFYASIHPDNNVIENLGQHFMRRLPSQNFIIHDKNRNIAFLYNTKEYEIIDSSNLNITSISGTEKKYQELWSTFFNTIAIKERKNSRLQMQYMPKKYWQDLIEMKVK